MANETLALWSAEGIGCTQLAHDIDSEVRVAALLRRRDRRRRKRIAVPYDEADLSGIVASAPGLGPVLSAAILANAGNFNRFANLARERFFTGVVPRVDQSRLTNGRKGITKAGGAGLRDTLYLGADHTRTFIRHWPSANSGSSWSKASTATQHCARSRPSSSPGSPPAGAKERELPTTRRGRRNDHRGRRQSWIDRPPKSGASSKYPGQTPQAQGSGSRRKG